MAEPQPLQEIGEFSEDERRILEPLLNWMRQPVKQDLYRPNDLVDERFAAHFVKRLQVFHATHSPDEVLTKKEFEFAFAEASKAAGHTAIVARSSTTPASDVTVDGDGYSLKTEADRNIRSGRIGISKLMESAWTKNARNTADFLAGIHNHVLPRIRHSKRIFVLRVFGRLSSHGKTQYELVEIPLEVFLAMDQVAKESFTKITRAGGTTCEVTLNGKPAFTLVFDGSDQKITVRKLLMDVCIRHAEWTLASPENG